MRSGVNDPRVNAVPSAGSGMFGCVLIEVRVCISVYNWGEVRSIHQGIARCFHQHFSQVWQSAGFVPILHVVIILVQLRHLVELIVSCFTLLLNLFLSDEVSL